MRLALVLLCAVGAFGGQPETFNVGWSILGPLPLAQQTPAEKALELNVYEELRVVSPSAAEIDIKEGTLVCNDGECYTVHFKKGTDFTLEPITDEKFLDAVRIYRYLVVPPETPQDAAASSCADDEEQVGDACIGDVGLNVLQGGLR